MARGMRWPNYQAPVKSPAARAVLDRMGISRDDPDSEIESILFLQLRADKLPPFRPHYRFHPERKFEFDVAWPEWKFAVEVEGMVHRIKARFESDIEKYALAQLLGWTVMRVSGRTIREGRAIGWVREYMENCQWIPTTRAN